VTAYFINIELLFFLFIIIERNLTKNRLDTIDLIDIRDRERYNVVVNFEPRTINKTTSTTTETTNQKAPTTSSKTTSSTSAQPIESKNNITASAIGNTIGFLIIVAFLEFCERDVNNSPLNPHEIKANRINAYYTNQMSYY
jgi:hypothetical protein